VLSRLIDLGLIDRQSPSGHSRRAVLRSAAKVGLAGAVAAPVISAVVPVAAAHASVRSSFTQLTPGYWKNHELQTTALLPQSLGTYYTVKSFTDATAVFDNMNNGNATALGGLAGQLLAAELNVAGGGGAPCVQAAISHANALLSSLFYVGPGPSYNLASWQRQDAIALGTTLANYNSGSSTC
jgi:hypothetical protein